MDPDVGTFAQVAVIIVTMAASLATIGVLAFRGMVRARRVPPPVQDDRLEHLQQSVDAIAVEVERIAEAQRFSAKLLAGRAEESTTRR
jgi:hypothetical protein